MRALLQTGIVPNENPTLSTLADVKKSIEECRGAYTLNAIIRIKLVWVSRHNSSKSDTLKLHLIDTDAPEPLEELYKMFRDVYATNAASVNSILLTATIFQADNIVAKDLPPDGCIVQINTCTHPIFFRGVESQLTIKNLHDITVDL
ncbi:hypothetical protein V7S43_017996 [Phytophthora oleae]|uniref:Uncharacterized protein n=1 Tax=Phytophthora oleae TaxID=2107226 RepID=A0ABD3ERL6_9STRA